MLGGDFAAVRPTSKAPDKIIDLKLIISPFASSRLSVLCPPPAAGIPLPDRHVRSPLAVARPSPRNINVRARASTRRFRPSSPSCRPGTAWACPRPFELPEANVRHAVAIEINIIKITKATQQADADIRNASAVKIQVTQVRAPFYEQSNAIVVHIRAPEVKPRTQRQSRSLIPTGPIFVCEDRATKGRYNL